ncbi:MAG: hypothetical protein ACI4SB_06410 [Acutalibacteraceae bacterium]
MNSFDLMMERYKKELVDANRRSIEQELLSQSDSSEPTAQADVQSEVAEPAVSVNAEPQMRTQADMTEQMESESQQASQEKEPMNMQTPQKAEEDPEDNSFGTLKVQVFAAQQVYPIGSARVIVRRHGEDKIIFEGYTDSSGIVDNIRLSSPGKSLSAAPNSKKPYSQYDVFVTQPNFVSRNYLGVPIFPGVESIQTVRLVPRQLGNDTTTVTTESEPNDLLTDKKGEQ